MLINYLPPFLQNIKEFKEIYKSLDIELDKIKIANDNLPNQGSILKANEERIKEWEEFLNITPQGTLQQRKLFIIATLTTVGKLNKTKIEEIVNVYTNGGGADVTFKDSTIYVKIRPPKGDESFLFEDIERNLTQAKPAHLALNITRYYTTWAVIKRDFNTWQDLKDTGKSWKKLIYFD